MDWVIELLAQIIGWCIVTILGIGVLFAVIAYLLSSPEERKVIRESSDTEAMVLGGIKNGTEPKE